MCTVGVLALQGDFEKHRAMLQRLGVAAPLVITPEGLASLDALVIPGGESTTIGKLMVSYGLLDPLRERVLGGMPVYGTCAGMILLAKEIAGQIQPRLGLMEIEVLRNAYGRQVVSFEADISVTFTSSPVRGVFIRAPIISHVGAGVSVLGEFEDKPVLVRQDNMLASSFHPELTDDTRIHDFFLSMLGR